MKKKIGIAAAVIFGILLMGFGALAAYLTFNEYQPGDQEHAEQLGTGTKKIREGDSLRIMTFHTGAVNGASRQAILGNLQGIADIIYEKKADIVFLQEVDRDAKRSLYIDQANYLMEANPGYHMTYAANYRCRCVPYPIPAAGKVESGIVTLGTLSGTKSTRIALPASGIWPFRAAEPKRCLLVTRILLEGSDKELVLVNLHLGAYDNREETEAKNKVLFDVLEQEYRKGNYCIAGGDFNQTFGGEGEEAYPVNDDKYFKPERMDTSALGEGWSFVHDVSVPTARLSDEPGDSDPERMQYDAVDGFIVSPNVSLEDVKTLDRGFTYSDHNPVIMKIILGAAKSEDKS